VEFSVFFGVVGKKAEFGHRQSGSPAALKNTLRIFEDFGKNLGFFSIIRIS
jgi:hypothetical protein